MRRFVLVATIALALCPAALAQNQGDEGGGGSWWGMPCTAGYLGWTVTINGTTAICINNGVYWEWWPL